MKICAIVAEYNPFHNGHKYQIEEIKRKTDADIIIAIMSGNFIERGLPASFDKWARAKMAIENGIDIVIELPTLYATASAEYFAHGAVSTLDKLNCVDYIAFGVKNEFEELFNKISNVLTYEPDEYKEELTKELNTGLSFPAARSKALQKYFKNEYNPDLVEEIMQDSNNILAIEYLKALNRNHSTISPIFIKRTGTDYNSLEINNGICSSTAIRNILKNDDLKTLDEVMPENALKILKEEIDYGKIPMQLENFEKEIMFSLRKISSEDLAKIADVGEGLENVIKKSILSSYDIETLIENIKSKRYTRTRVQRILLHVLLNINEDLLKEYRDDPQYARILGVSKNGKNLLSQVTNASSIPIITSVTKFINDANDKQKKLLQLDIEATNIYTLGYQVSNNKKYNLDYTNQFITQ